MALVPVLRRRVYRADAFVLTQFDPGLVTETYERFSDAMLLVPGDRSSSGWLRARLWIEPTISERLDRLSSPAEPDADGRTG